MAPPGDAADAPKARSVRSRLKDIGLHKRLSRRAFKFALSVQSMIEECAKGVRSRRSANWKLVVPIFSEPVQRWRARFWASVYFSMLLSDVFIEYRSTAITILLSTSLEILDAESFFYYLWFWNVCIAIQLLQSAILEHSKWELRMIVQWRVTFYMVAALYSGDTYYHMHSQRGAPAPESLICNEGFMWLHQTVLWMHQNIRAAAKFVSSLYMLIFKLPVIAVYMIISVPIRGALARYMWPSRLGKLYHMNLQTGWDLQITMGRVADSAEQIALMRGGSAELRRFEGLMDVSTAISLKEIWWQKLYEVGITLAGTGMMLPVYYAMFNMIMNGSLTISAALTYGAKGSQMTEQFGGLVSTSVHLQRCETSAARMVALVEEGEAHVRKANLISLHGRRTSANNADFFTVHELAGESQSTTELELRDVTIWTPGEPRQVIVKDFSLRLCADDSLLVIGNTGIGKSVLLRAIHGLWTNGCGKISRCPAEMISCVPQRPFMFNASLRDNLLYPQMHGLDTISDEEILDTLRCVNMDSIIGVSGIHTKNSWQGVLSLGQQQRLGFARVLLKPKIRLLLLDEATSALDMQNERRLYKHVRDTFPCYISVAHRPSVREYHTHVAVMEFNEKLEGGLAVASFVPMGELDAESFKRVTQMENTAASEEEKLWALKRRTEAEAIERKQGGDKAGKRPPEPAQPVEPNGGKSALAEVTRTTSMLYTERRWGGFSLLRRGFVDVLLPMMRQRYTWQPLIFAFGLTYGASFLSLSLESYFLYPYSQVIKVLQSKNRSLVWKFYFQVIVPYFPCCVVMFVIADVARQWLSTVTRMAVKRDLAKRYLDGKTDAYYHMNLGRLLIGNPGTRISTWDTDAANGWLVGLVTTAASTFFAIMIACQQLASMSQVTLYVFLVFIAVGAIITITLSNFVFNLYRAWLEKTMELFTRTLEVRENAEAVAMLRGADYESSRAFQILDAAITPGSMYLWLRDVLEMFGEVYFSQVVRIVLQNITGPMVLHGDLSFEQQNMMVGIVSGGSAMVHGLCAGLFTNVEGQVAMERLWEIAAVTHHIQKRGRGIFGKGRWGGDIALEEDPDLDCALMLEDFTLRTPANPWLPSKIICDGLSLRVEHRDSLLIAGESGVGKSSVLRAVAGLWRHGEGTIRVPHDSRSYFIPQRPYMFCGTLREQLLYPGISRRDIDDDKLIEAVRRVELSHLLAHPGLGEHRQVIEKTGDVTSEKDRFWFFRLSLGEVQRLSFARLLLKEDIQLVFLDEATSALSTEAEETAYGFVKEKTSSYISVAHRPQLRTFHNNALVLLKDSVNETTVCRKLPMSEYEEELRKLTAQLHDAPQAASPQPEKEGRSQAWW